MKTLPVRILRAPSTQLLSVAATPACPPRAPWCCLSLENSAKLPRGRILDMGGGGKLWFPISPHFMKNEQVTQPPWTSISSSVSMGSRAVLRARAVYYTGDLPQVDPGTRTASYSLREMSQLHPYLKEQPIPARFRQSSLLYGLCRTCFCLKRSDLCTVCLARMKAPGQQRPCLRLLERT